MKKNIVRIIIALLIISLSNSCNKIDKLLTFYISDQSETVIESNLLPFNLSLPFEFPIPEITTNSEKEFENNNTKIELVKDISVEEVKLTITSPDDKTFSFLKSIHIYISTNDEPEIEIAYKDNIESDAKIIELTTTKEDLDKYVKSPKYKLRTEATVRETLTQDVGLLIDLKFKVTADPL